jgi:hypothetical protein
MDAIFRLNSFFSSFFSPFHTLCYFDLIFADSPSFYLEKRLSGKRQAQLLEAKDAPRRPPQTGE